LRALPTPRIRCLPPPWRVGAVPVVIQLSCVFRLLPYRPALQVVLSQSVAAPARLHRKGRKEKRIRRKLLIFKRKWLSCQDTPGDPLGLSRFEPCITHATVIRSNPRSPQLIFNHGGGKGESTSTAGGGRGSSAGNIIIGGQSPNGLCPVETGGNIDCFRKRNTRGEMISSPLPPQLKGSGP
jgi:hypothetical protein